MGGGGGHSDVRKPLSAIQDEAMGHDKSKADFFSARVTVFSILYKNKPISYPSCAKCKKKVVEEMGNWKCEACKDVSQGWRMDCIHFRVETVRLIFTSHYVQ